MTKTQFLPIFLGRRYERSKYFWVQNFQGYPPYAQPRIKIYEVPPGELKNETSLPRDLQFWEMNL